MEQIAISWPNVGLVFSSVAFECAQLLSALIHLWRSTFGNMLDEVSAWVVRGMLLVV